MQGYEISSPTAFFVVRSPFQQLDPAAIGDPVLDLNLNKDIYKFEEIIRTLKQDKKQVQVQARAWKNRYVTKKSEALFHHHHHSSSSDGKRQSTLFKYRVKEYLKHSNIKVMSEEFWLKTTSDDEVFTPYLNNTKQVKTFENNPTTPHEVFRNDTTSVEVIVKQVKNKKKMEPSKHSVALEQINDRLCEDIENLKRELNTANKNLEDTKKCFRLVMFEMAKQLEAANQRELKRQTKYLVQQLEKEKLKTILESKTNLVKKLRRELLNVKRITKAVIKGIRSVPHSETAVQSDLEYTEFESDLKTPKTSIVNNNMCGVHEDTYETTLSSKF